MAKRPNLRAIKAARADTLQEGANTLGVTVGADQLCCLSCKLGQSPLGMIVDCLPQTATTARLVGLCGVGGGTCNRMISRANLGRLGGIFDVAYPDHR